MRRLIACLALIACSCNREGPEQIYARAVRAFRDSQRTEAIRLASDAEARFPTRSAGRWMSRLLRAEIALGDGTGTSAGILSESVPSGRDFVDVQCKRLTLQAALQI